MTLTKRTTQSHTSKTPLKNPEEANEQGAETGKLGLINKNLKKTK